MAARSWRRAGGLDRRVAEAASRVVDLMHEWAVEALHAETSHLIGHRYTHVAPSTDETWDVVSCWPKSVLDGYRATEFVVGPVECVYMEHPWGEVVGYGPQVEPLASLLIVSENRAAVCEMMVQLQEGADYLVDGGEPTVLDGQHRAVGTPTRMLPRNRR